MWSTKWDISAKMATILAAQETMITMLQRYIYATYPKGLAVVVFSRVISCISYLKDLTLIKKRREMANASNNFLGDQIFKVEDNSEDMATMTVARN